MMLGIYSLSYKNLRRNWWRTSSTVLRIAFGVIILLILVSSGIGISTVLGQNTGSNGISKQTNNHININNALNTLNVYINSLLGTEISNSQLIISIRSILRNIISFIDIIASIVFLVGVFGITYAMDLNLLERKREIGILKAIGFTELQIMLSLLFEAGFLGFLGALIGTLLVIIGITVLSSLVKIQLFSIVMPIWLPFAAISITTLLSTMISAFSVWYNVTQDPVEALRI